MQSSIKGTLKHLMETYGDRIKHLATTNQTFEGLVTRWNIVNEPPPEESKAALEGHPRYVDFLFCFCVDCAPDKWTVF
jgi:hypothetical protein